MRHTKRIGFSVAMTVLMAAFEIQALNAAATESKSTTPQEVFDRMRRSFQADKAKDVQARYQWKLSGPNGGEWWIEVHNGTFKMGKGTIDNPNVTFIATDKTWVALSNGTLSGTWAFLIGRLKIRGDHGLAKKLGEMFP